MDIKQAIIDWYESAGEEYQLRGDRLTSRCTYHGGDNPNAFSINLNTGSFTCFTRHCKFDPYAYFKLSKFGSRKQFNHTKGVAPKNEKVSYEYYKYLNLSESYLGLYKKPYGDYRNYLIKRGLNELDVDRYEIRCCDDEESKDYRRIVFPIRNGRGQLVNFSMRSIDDSIEPKYTMYAKPKFDIFYNVNRLLPEFPLVITEGVLDCISLSKFGINNVLSTSSLYLTKYQLGFLTRPQYPEIILAFDNPEIDSASSEATERHLSTLAKACPDKYFSIMFYPKGFKDWNDTLRNGKRDEVQQIYNNLKFIKGKEL